MPSATTTATAIAKRLIGGLTSALWRAEEGAQRRGASVAHQRAVRPHAFTHGGGASDKLRLSAIAGEDPARLHLSSNSGCVITIGVPQCCTHASPKRKLASVPNWSSQCVRS